MDLKSGNPALSPKTFDGLDESADPMTLSGTINKAAILFAILLIGAGWVWNLYFTSHAIDDVMIYLAVGAIGGFVVALVTIFNKPISPYTSPVYAILEGFAIGAVSALYEAKRPGIALQAVGLTMGTLACMLAAYRFQIIKVTENFKMGIVAATGGIAILYMGDRVQPVRRWHRGTQSRDGFRFHRQGRRPAKPEVHGVVLRLRPHRNPGLAVPGNPAPTGQAPLILSTAPELASRCGTGSSGRSTIPSFTPSPPLNTKSHLWKLTSA
jgi:hypothetical protein